MSYKTKPNNNGRRGLDEAVRRNFVELVGRGRKRDALENYRAMTHEQQDYLKSTYPAEFKSAHLCV